MGRYVIPTILVLFLPWQALGASGVYYKAVQDLQPCHYYQYNELSGTTATDVANQPGGGNCSSGLTNGTYTSTFALGSPGIPGTVSQYSVGFTGIGTAGYVIAANGDVPTSTSGQGFSAEFWMYPTTVATTQFPLINNNSGSPADYRAYDFAMVNNQIRFLAFSNVGVGACSVPTYGSTGFQGAITANAWHHIVGTSIGAGSSQLTNMKLYIDGALAATTTSFSGNLCDVAFNTMTARALVDTGNTANFAGRIDELALYRGAAGELSATTVKQHYFLGISERTNAAFTVYLDEELRDSLHRYPSWLKPASFDLNIPVRDGWRQNAQ